jgi:outer membrane protein OmpA-like peptidoglycan-associated protein
MQGHCTNLPINCDKAKNHDLIDMPTIDTRCPECGLAVKAFSGPIKDPPGTGPKKGVLIAASIVGGLAVLTAGGVIVGNLLGHKKPTAPIVVHPVSPIVSTLPPAPVVAKPPSPIPGSSAPYAASSLPPQPPLPSTATATGPCTLSAHWPGARDELCQIQMQALHVDVDFRFEKGSAALDSAADDDLRALQRLVKGTPGSRLLIAGFANHEGGRETPCKLSDERAQAVLKALGKAGVEDVAAKGFCDELPQRDEAAAADDERNQRVEVFLYPH